ncbi:hypothetical protein EYZ11_010910 [Aspergillus tanneri]|uniref:Ketoreductase (KR) domain-containing protein n=1 Tax=Aspergillus tanneri TaxID=1220188 RepID=A0A4S3J6B8_9EURO|nr:hypothetical protein EYZ11_010910 [Aspergillus tanneri]
MQMLDPMKITDLSGKVSWLAHHPANIYLAARSHTKAEAARDRIRAISTAASIVGITILELDLASLDSARKAAARVDREVTRLGLLHLNGRIVMTPYDTAVDGFELQFGTNYLGHALLMQLLMRKLLATARRPHADVHIVSMSSVGQDICDRKGHRVRPAPIPHVIPVRLNAVLPGYAGQDPLLSRLARR